MVTLILFIYFRDMRPDYCEGVVPFNTIVKYPHRIALKFVISFGEFVKLKMYYY